MLLLKYLRDHISFSFTVIGIYSVVFLALIISISELFFVYGYDDHEISGLTYSFQIYDWDVNAVRSIADDINGYEDICVYSKREEYILIAYVTNPSELRGPSINGLPTGTDVIKTDNSIFAQSLIDEDDCIVINGQKCRVSGSIELDNGIENEIGTYIYCSLDLFSQLIDNNDPIFASVLYDEKLTEDAVAELNEIIHDRLGTTAFIPPANDKKEIEIVTSEDMRMIIVLAIIGGICFSRLLVSVIQNRENEFKILKICGASNNKIDQLVLDHVLFILLLSECLGTLLFWVVRVGFPKLIVYSKGSIFLYLISYIIFTVIGVITFWLIEIIRRYRIWK